MNARIHAHALTFKQMHQINANINKFKVTGGHGVQLLPPEICIFVFFHVCERLFISVRLSPFGERTQHKHTERRPLGRCFHITNGVIALKAQITAH